MSDQNHLRKEDPETPPSMLREGRLSEHARSKSSLGGALVANQTDMIDIKLKASSSDFQTWGAQNDSSGGRSAQVLIRILARQCFLDSQKTTYSPLKNRGELMPSVEWMIMAHLWRLQSTKMFASTFPKGFGMTNCQLSKRVFIMVERVTSKMRMRFQCLIMCNLEFQSAPNAAVPTLEQLILKINRSFAGQFYQMKPEDIDRIALMRLIAVESLCSATLTATSMGPFWPLVDLKVKWIITHLIKHKQIQYHKTIKEIDRHLFDGVRPFGQVVAEEMALIKVFKGMGESLYSYRLPMSESKLVDL
ncbi:uncharacterized protein MELLADRAFT_60700 [Melampsora larici-populina 98AG31]|uniref:Uncharacterized protein n=1 Tax=Melampsora larici-populina (strain 98AG31 / pathotype 3-4-7) TaxID=747676 RepID=F4RC06_MELLP|nr:uncharacterized protein MELLADRAFT_60700 [Melampsora larici-populina 98AG31]EGG10245.1 hypothetical protein MELLADRAFT_60700 [Melampsora larici-populina 98AG31]